MSKCVAGTLSGEACQAWRDGGAGFVRRDLWRSGFDLDIVTCLDIGRMEGMRELQTEEENE